MQFDNPKKQAIKEGRKTLHISKIVVPIQSVEDEHAVEELKVEERSLQSDQLR